MSTASSTILEPEWFTRPTCVVAADLIGKVLCRQLTDSDGQQETLRMRISETEAYIGQDDPLPFTCRHSNGAHRNYV